MKKLAITLAATLMLMLPSLSFSAAKARTFTGEIMDSQCAKMGSHEMMVKKEMPDKASMYNDPQVKAMCTKQCVKMGGKYVLYNAARKAVYQLDDQTKPEEFAGENVTIKGTYDRATKTIHVASIEAAK